MSKLKMSTKYYKIIGNNFKTTTGEPYPYRLGMNTLKHVGEAFNPEPVCARGGLYFTTIENILAFIEYGDTLCELVVPKNTTIVQVGNKFKSAKIIIEKMLPLWTTSTFEFLIEHGADIHAFDDYALQCANNKGHLSVVEFLVEHGANIHVDNDRAFRWASHSGHLSVVEFLVKRGVDIHALDDYALRWASSNGHFSVVEFLVEHGANIHNDRVLRWASHGGHLSVVKFLVEHGADIHADDDYAVRMASYCGHLSVVEFLVEHGADVHAYNDEAVRIFPRLNF